MKTDLFPVLWPLLSFPNLLAYWMQHSIASPFRIWNSSTGIPSPPLALFVVKIQIDGETVETVRDFILGGSKITADGNCSHEIKEHLLLGRKVMTNLDSILKSRDIILPTKVRLVKAVVFPVVMYGCESWTVKNAEHRIIDAFELWCWRRLLRVPWTARKNPTTPS